MSEGNIKCKMFKSCNHYTTVDKCTTACEFYNPKNPNEVIDIPKEVIAQAEAKEQPDLKLELSNLPKFDKIHEFFVMKSHVFMMQSVSPKKIILKYKRKLKKSDNLADGCYIFKDAKGELLQSDKVFKKMDQDKAKRERKGGSK